MCHMVNMVKTGFVAVVVDGKNVGSFRSPPRDTYLNEAGQVRQRSWERAAIPTCPPSFRPRELRVKRPKGLVIWCATCLVRESAAAETSMQRSAQPPTNQQQKNTEKVTRMCDIGARQP